MKKQIVMSLAALVGALVVGGIAACSSAAGGLEMHTGKYRIVVANEAIGQIEVSRKNADAGDKVSVWTRGTVTAMLTMIQLPEGTVPDLTPDTESSPPENLLIDWGSSLKCLSFIMPASDVAVEMMGGTATWLQKVTIGALDGSQTYYSAAPLTTSLGVDVIRDVNLGVAVETAISGLTITYTCVDNDATPDTGNDGVRNYVSASNNFTLLGVAEGTKKRLKIYAEKDGEEPKVYTYVLSPAETVDSGALLSQVSIVPSTNNGQNIVYYKATPVVRDTEATADDHFKYVSVAKSTELAISWVKTRNTGISVSVKKAGESGYTGVPSGSTTVNALTAAVIGADFSDPDSWTEFHIKAVDTDNGGLTQYYSFKVYALDNYTPVIPPSISTVTIRDYNGTAVGIFEKDRAADVDVYYQLKKDGVANTQVSAETGLFSISIAPYIGGSGLAATPPKLTYQVGGAGARADVPSTNVINLTGLTPSSTYFLNIFAERGGVTDSFSFSMQTLAESGSKTIRLQAISFENILPADFSFAPDKFVYTGHGAPDNTPKIIVPNASSSIRVMLTPQTDFSLYKQVSYITLNNAVVDYADNKWVEVQLPKVGEDVADANLLVFTVRATDGTYGPANGYQIPIYRKKSNDIVLKSAKITIPGGAQIVNMTNSFPKDTYITRYNGTGTQAPLDASVTHLEVEIIPRHPGAKVQVIEIPYNADLTHPDNPYAGEPMNIDNLLFTNSSSLTWTDITGVYNWPVPRQGIAYDPLDDGRSELTNTNKQANWLVFRVVAEDGTSSAPVSASDAKAHKWLAFKKSSASDDTAITAINIKDKVWGMWDSDNPSDAVIINAAYNQMGRIAEKIDPASPTPRTSFTIYVSSLNTNYAVYPSLRDTSGEATYEFANDKRIFDPAGIIGDETNLANAWKPITLDANKKISFTVTAADGITTKTYHIETMIWTGPGFETGDKLIALKTNSPGNPLATEGVTLKKDYLWYVPEASGGAITFINGGKDELHVYTALEQEQVDGKWEAWPNATANWNDSEDGATKWLKRWPTDDTKGEFIFNFMHTRSSNDTIYLLLVGGGGKGGFVEEYASAWKDGGAGGGGGQVIERSAFQASAQKYEVIAGKGGDILQEEKLAVEEEDDYDGFKTKSINGNNSVFKSIGGATTHGETALGGEGALASWNNQDEDNKINTAGLTDEQWYGAGGTIAASGRPGAGRPGQYTAGNYYSSGGGGGAGAGGSGSTASSGSNPDGGSGGNGYKSSITGSEVEYGKGGAGGVTAVRGAGFGHGGGRSDTSQSTGNDDRCDVSDNGKNDRTNGGPGKVIVRLTRKTYSDKAKVE
jgi:hypothetical protein